MQLSSAVRRRQQQAASLLVLVACSLVAGERVAQDLDLTGCHDTNMISM
jgi:hypothetical protein